MNKLYLICLFFWAILIPSISFAQEEVEPYQISLINPAQLVNEYRSIEGLRVNLVYGVNDNISGLDMGVFNIAKGKQKGLQIGIYNSSFKSSGVQIGIVNRTEYLSGIQIGLLNIHVEGNWKMMPIVNYSF